MVERGGGGGETDTLPARFYKTHTTTRVSASLGSAATVVGRPEEGEKRRMQGEEGDSRPADGRREGPLQLTAIIVLLPSGWCSHNIPTIAPGGRRVPTMRIFLTLTLTLALREGNW